MPPHDHPDSGTPSDWLRRARSSFALAQVAKPDATCWEELCFQAQQGAEKAIKAVMLHRDVRFSYVHDLGRLLSELEAGGHPVPDEVKGCVTITPYAFQTRYPGDYEPVTEADYRRALEQTEKVLAWAAEIVEGEHEHGNRT